VVGAGCQDAGGGGDSFRTVLAPAVRDIRPDQAGRRHGGLGGGRSRRGNSDRPVAWRLQFLHQPDPVRFLQQQVQERLRRYFAEQALLWPSSVLRNGGCRRIVLSQYAQVVLLLKQQLVDTQASTSYRAAGAGRGRTRPCRVGRLLHLQLQRIHSCK